MRELSEQDGGRCDIFVFHVHIKKWRKYVATQLFMEQLCVSEKNCLINHRGSKVYNKIGFIVVAKSSEVVFFDLSTNHTNVTTELIEKWLSCKKTLEEWNELFALDNATEHHESLSVESIGAAQTFLKFERG
jgi:hypothetical protein